MEIVTKRTRIRPFRQTDIADLYQVLSDNDVMQYIEPAFNYEKTVEFVSTQGLCNPPRIYALEDRKSETVIGHVIFHPYDEEQSYELGWILHKDYWHMGLASEITEALIQYARIQNIPHLILECAHEQTATKRIAEKFGFQHIDQEETSDIYKLTL